MTADMTFKEFVEANNLSFVLLDFDSQEYRDLVDRFNAYKFRLEAEEEAREHAAERIRLNLVKPAAAQKPGRPRRTPRRAAA